MAARLGRRVHRPGHRPAPRRPAGTPDEIVGMVVHLAGDASGYTTGAVIAGRRRTHGRLLMRCDRWIEPPRRAVRPDRPRRGRDGRVVGTGHGFARTLAGAGATVYAAARRLERLEALARRTTGIVPVRCDITDAGPPVTRRPGRGRHGRRRRAGQQRRPSPAARARDRVARPNSPRFSTSTCRRDSTSPSPWRRPSAEAGRLDHQHLLGRRARVDGADRRRELRRVQSRRARPDPRAGRAVGPRGIRVNAIVPGLVRHRDDRRTVQQRASAGWVRRNTMLGRGGARGEVDGALLFLASDASSLRHRPDAGRRRRMDGPMTMSARFNPDEEVGPCSSW